MIEKKQYCFEFALLNKKVIIFGKIVKTMNHLKRKC